MFSYCEQIWTRAKIHVQSFTSILRFEFRANYPNYFCYHLKYLSDRRPRQKLSSGAFQNRPKFIRRCPPYSGAPNDGFLPNALKRRFTLSGVLLKLCRLILGCAIKFWSVRFSRGTVVFPNLLGFFVHFPKTLGLISFPKILADLFLCQKRHFCLSENKRH